MKKRTKYKINIKKEYKKSFTYLRDSNYFIYSILFLFILFVFVGFFIPAPEIISESLLEFLKELVEKTAAMSGFELAKFIFLNNLQSSFLGMILGVFFGFLSIFFGIFNGYVLGFVLALSVEAGGVFVLFQLFPHGIFELPAIFISLGMGLKLGSFVFEKNKIKSLKEYLINSLRVFLLIVIPLLFVAAIIEALFIYL